MNDRTRGLYPIYKVERLDSSTAPGQKHASCFHFVLDAAHDPCALPALRAYADACERDYPLLAADLRRVIADGARSLAERERSLDPRHYEKPALRLLKEALEREQAPEPEALRYAKSVRVSEYTADVARHAKECLVELRVLFPDPDQGEGSTP